MALSSIWSQIRAKPGLGIAVAVALAILLGLGTWQVARLKWKTDLINDLARSEVLTPVRLEEALALGKGAAWRRVDRIPCAVTSDRIIYLHAIKDGKPGYHLITVCPMTQAQALVVDLGFSELRPLAFAPQNLTLSGRLRPLDKANPFTPPNNLKADDWYARTPADLSQQFGQTVRGDYFLIVDLARTGVTVSGLSQGPITAELPNNHLEYALTWYGLAVVMLAFYGLMLRSKTPDAKPQQ